MPDAPVAYVALGSNLDAPRAQVERGCDALAGLAHTTLQMRSRLYRTAPVGGVVQPDYVNAAARIATTLPPRELLDALLAIEARAGRVRNVRNGPRTLDLDLLLYGDRRCNDPALVIPHPRMHERAFVLLPLADLEPDLLVPGHGRVLDLLAGVETSGCTLLA